MGSLTSRPKAPAAQSPQIIYYTPPTTTGSSTGSASQTEPDPAELAKTRAENVARRSRGLMGTVPTTLNGFLSDSATPDSTPGPARKTLLGE